MNDRNKPFLLRLPMIMWDIWRFCPRSGELLNKYGINYKEVKEKNG